KMHRDMVKIGFTQGSVIERLKRLNNPTQIDMLNKNRVRYEEFGLYPLDEYSGNELDEAYAHYELAANGRYVGLGEMFKCTRQETQQLFSNFSKN
ncbi:MAG: GIY-YIG nuclease family protein, partial [Desulfamplus sp.]|nr:GIY-YIG nuclease family protein [Desulfamplus sp.]